VLVTVFNLSGSPESGFRAALLTGGVFLVAALVMSVRAALQARPDRTEKPEKLEKSGRG
jgi:hypothetical protein